MNLAWCVDVAVDVAVVVSVDVTVVVTVLVTDDDAVDVTVDVAVDVTVVTPQLEKPPLAPMVTSLLMWSAVASHESAVVVCNVPERSHEMLATPPESAVGNDGRVSRYT